MNKTRSVSGFTLLEAVVALTIFSMSSVAIYSWYGTTLLGLIHVQERTRANAFADNLESYLRSLQLKRETAGEYRANGYRADWSARLVEPKKDNVNIAGITGYYAVGLYDVKISIYRDDSKQLVEELETRLVGYEDVRVPDFFEEFGVER